jgi:predicted small secreted protein
MVSGVMKMVRKVVTLALVAGTMVLAACNTVDGVGKDVSSAGGAVSDAAK